MADDTPDLERFRTRFEQSPAWRYFNQRLLEVQVGRSRLELSLEPYQNVFGTGHGGVLAFLMDSAMAVAARGALGLETALYTIEFKVSFLAPAPPETVYGEGRLMRAGRSIAFTEAYVIDKHGQQLAVSLGTFGIRKPPGTSP